MTKEKLAEANMLKAKMNDCENEISIWKSTEKLHFYDSKESATYFFKVQDNSPILASIKNMMLQNLLKELSQLQKQFNEL